PTRSLYVLAPSVRKALDSQNVALSGKSNRDTIPPPPKILPSSSSISYRIDPKSPCRGSLSQKPIVAAWIIAPATLVVMRSSSLCDCWRLVTASPVALSDDSAPRPRRTDRETSSQAVPAPSVEDATI